MPKRANLGRHSRTEVETAATRLGDELAAYKERNPLVADALRIFEEADREFERSIAALNRTRVVVSDSSYGPTS